MVRLFDMMPVCAYALNCESMYVDTSRDSLRGTRVCSCYDFCLRVLLLVFGAKLQGDVIAAVQIFIFKRPFVAQIRRARRCASSAGRCCNPTAITLLPSSSVVSHCCQDLTPTTT